MSRPDVQPNLPYRVLCVDDERMLALLIKELLELTGQKVDVAESGRKALQLFRAALKSEPYDVVITDLGMPQMDGWQLTKALRKEQPDLPIILLTGWDRVFEEHENKLQQVSMVLAKPPQLSSLLEAIRKVCPRPRGSP